MNIYLFTHLVKTGKAQLQAEGEHNIFLNPLLKSSVILTFFGSVISDYRSGSLRGSSFSRTLNFLIVCPIRQVCSGRHTAVTS